MAHRNTYEAKARTVDPADRAHEHEPRGATGGTRIVEYLGLLGLALAGILLVGFVANLLFGSSVSTVL